MHSSLVEVVVWLGATQSTLTNMNTLLLVLLL